MPEIAGLMSSKGWEVMERRMSPKEEVLAKKTYARLRSIAKDEAFMEEHGVGNHNDVMNPQGDVLSAAHGLLVSGEIPLTVVAAMVADHKERYRKQTQAVADVAMWNVEKRPASRDDVLRHLSSLSKEEKELLHRMYLKTVTLDVLMQIALYVKNQAH